jgi:hypothetical protein
MVRSSESSGEWSAPLNRIAEDNDVGCHGPGLWEVRATASMRRAGRARRIKELAATGRPTYAKTSRGRTNTQIRIPVLWR